MIYLILFWEFFQIGLFTFGGGFGMIPLIKERVLAYGWMSEDSFYSLIGVCESTPGPIAVNMATYIGSTQGGILGSIAATLGVVLPSFLIILLIAALLKNMTQNRLFQSFMKGVKPVIVALILSTGLVMLAKAVGWGGGKSFAFSPVSASVFAVLAVLYFLVPRLCKRKLSSIAMICIAAVLGIAGGIFLP